MVVPFEDCEWCMPSEFCCALIHFIAPEHVGVLVEPGAGFVLHEGARVAARGTVIEVVAQVP